MTDDKQFPPEECYAQAEAALARSKTARDKEAKETWLDIAKNWERLGRLIEGASEAQEF